MAGGAVTVTGASGATNSVQLNTDQTFALAQQIANAINAAAVGGTLTTFDLPDTAPPVPSGNIGEAVIPVGAIATSFTAPAGYQYLIDADTVPVTVTGAANQTVLAGTGGLTLTAPGNNTVVVGGGTNAIVLAGSTNRVVLGDGNDNVYSNTATNSTIEGGTGAATIWGSSSGGNVDFLGAGTSLVIEGASSDTIIAGSGNALVFGNTGNDLVFGDAGALIFVGGTGASTVVGGGTGPTLFGSDGSNISFYGSAAGAVYAAGSGNETLDGSASRVGGQFYAAGGADTILAGIGGDTMVAGSGAMYAVGGAGSDVFGFVSGHAGGTDFIQNFAPNDKLLLVGYGSGGITSSTTVGGSTVVTLSDNTTITFNGVSNLDPNQIIKF